MVKNDPVLYHRAMFLLALFAAFILVPLAEIALFIQVGQLIGTGLTIAIILALALTGAYLVRWQGVVVLNKIKDAFAFGEIPGNEMIDGLLVLVAGALLIAPGFVTDVIGLFILLPPGRTLVRKAIKRMFRRRAARYQFVVRV